MTLTDPFASAMSQVAGGPIGRHARRAAHHATAAPVALAIGTLTWLLTILKYNPCRPVPGKPDANAFARQCYTDIPLLFQSRGLADGNTPLFDLGNYQVFEYPVGTAYLAELNRLITVALGAPVGPGLNTETLAEASNIFFLVNIVVLFVLFAVAIFAQVFTATGRPWDALMVAASPTVILTGLINWDMLPVALASLGMMFWARRRPGWAGIFFGLGMAAKLYPLFLLGPLLLLCLRARRINEFVRTVVGFAVAWLAANLPVMIAAPEQWKVFWTFNTDRQGDFGSLWYVFELAGRPLEDVNLWSTGTFLFGCAVVGALCLLAPRRPRIGQVMFLVLYAFMVTNKVYSPQYVLWLLPMLVLARPRWREWIIFTIGEWLYVMAIWGHLGQYITPGGGGPDKLYWAATILRLLTQSWVAAVVIRDILAPHRDPVRQALGGREPTTRDRENDPAEVVDDPSGGVLDGATDAGWVTVISRRVADSMAGVRPLITPAPSGASRTVVPGVAEGLGRTDRGGLRWVVGGWLATKALVVIALIYATTHFEVPMSIALRQWDATHFLGIATDGYLADPKRMAFFPGLSMLMKPFVAIGLPGEVVGALLAWVACLAAAIALYRMAGVWAALLWLAAPTMVFTSVAYTEAFFCAFAFWAWERARRDHWWAAALLAAGACAFRVSGVFLVVAMAVMIVFRIYRQAVTDDDGFEIGEHLIQVVRRGVWLVIPTVVVLGYLAYLHQLTGSWSAWIDAQQSGWVRGWTWPWDSFMNTWPVIKPGGSPDNPDWVPIFRMEVVSMIVGLLATGFLLRRRAWAEATYVGLQVISFATSYWLFSVNRAVLLWFPVWLIAAEFIAHKPRTARGLAAHRVAHITWVVISLTLGMWWATTYFRGAWSS